MAEFEVPATIKIFIPEEKDVPAGRRTLLTTLAQSWLNLNADFAFKDARNKTTKMGLTIVIEDAA